MTIHVVGLGPSGPHFAPSNLVALTKPLAAVIGRTRHHPAIEMVAEMRPVEFCDDLYESEASFDAVYESIVQRILVAADQGDVAYLVPGSPMVGERSVRMLVEAAELQGTEVVMHAAPSFIDLVLAETSIDPLADGLKVLDGRELPRPLSFEVPTIIGQVDLPEILADVLAAVDRAVPEDTVVSVLVDLGSPDSVVVKGNATSIDPSLAGLRTSVFVPAIAGGLAGAVSVMERLRAECPWDRSQTHESLVRYLMEESAELADAISGLENEEDWTGYAEVEDELGDVLLQVLFHAEIARRNGAFDITDVAENLRRKLVRRHPHVFAGVDADDAETVVSNWQTIKATERAERGEQETLSALDGIPDALGPLSKAAEIGRKAAETGFDWPDWLPVIDDLAEELDELREANTHAARQHELGDVLFAAVNVARHLDIDPDMALRKANQRFVRRFQIMESYGSLLGLSLDAMNQRWEAAKATERANPPD